MQDSVPKNSYYLRLSFYNILYQNHFVYHFGLPLCSSSGQLDHMTYSESGVTSEKSEIGGVVGFETIASWELLCLRGRR